jgi:hypothetical protein
MLESATIKRTIMCELVLITSLLIILTIIAVPFVNMKVFTNAMAVVIDPAINDTSQNNGGYLDTLKNDGNNIKYKVQSNNNDDNNYVDKKMSSYDNNYDDKNNKYPTRDKIYLCQSGPFEGFFVSSVEFCDLRSSHR